MQEEEEDQDADSENSTTGGGGGGGGGNSFHGDMFTKTQSEIHHYYSICRNREGIVPEISTGVKMSLSESCNDPTVMVGTLSQVVFLFVTCVVRISTRTTCSSSS